MIDFIWDERVGIHLHVLLTCICRIHEVKSCLECCLVTSSIGIETSSSMNAVTVSDLVSLVKRCLSVATSYSCAWTTPPKDAVKLSSQGMWS